MPRLLVASLTFAAAVLAWIWIVGAIGIWWTLRHPPAPVPGTDTYFMTSSRIHRLAVVLPLILFSAWYWRRISRAA